MSEELADRFQAMFGCDEVRLLSPLGERVFLILGWRRRSEGEWHRNGEPVDFDYLEEMVVASGSTDEQLVASAERYKALRDGGWREFFRQEGLPITPGLDDAIAQKENADRAAVRPRRGKEER